MFLKQQRNSVVKQRWQEQEYSSHDHNVYNKFLEESYMLFI